MSFPQFWISTFKEIYKLLVNHKLLIFELAKREIKDKYSGQIFGLVWAVGHPVIQVLVYIFIFGFVFKVKIGGTPEMPLDYSSYILSGIIPWLTFIESMNKAVFSVSGHASMVKQMIFPIDVLPIKGVLSSMINQVIFLIILIFYNLIASGGLSKLIFIIPALIFMQIIAMIGFSHILSAIGVFFKDLKDFVQIFGLINVYLIPAFYLPSFVPEFFKPFLYSNPFSYMIWCYQDVFYFGRFEHPKAWGVFLIFSITIFGLGYLLFKKLRPMFANVL